MKRLGPVRECDSRYLSGRPSFTISTWGETHGLTHEQLTEIGNGDRALGAHQHNRRSKFYASQLTKSRPGSGTARGNFKEATHVYTSDEPPILSHVWPTISAERLEQYAVLADEGTQAAMVQLTKNKKRGSIDAYAAGGSKFRMSTAGTGFNTHSAIDKEALTPADRRHYEEHQKRERANESKRDKPRWNRSPHVPRAALPKLADDPAMSPEQATMYRKKSGKKKAASAYGGKPIRLARPELKVAMRTRSPRSRPAAPARGVYVTTTRQSQLAGQGRISSKPALESFGEEDEEWEEDEEGEEGKHTYAPAHEGDEVPFV